MTHSMTLREAARRTSRSITTLRRHIRHGRLRAEKRQGRFGPEYVVSERELAQAGLDAESVEPEHALMAGRPGEEHPDSRPARHHGSVPLALYQELQMKHEQLLVQYGMVRAGGLRVLELRAALEEQQLQLEAGEARLALSQRQTSEETERLTKLLHQVELEREGQSLEILALREKVRGLEMLTRNAVTSQSIEKQFSEIMAQTHRVDHLVSRASPPEADGVREPSPRPRQRVDPDH